MVDKLRATIQRVNTQLKETPPHLIRNEIYKINFAEVFEPYLGSLLIQLAFEQSEGYLSYSTQKEREDHIKQLIGEKKVCGTANKKLLREAVDDLSALISAYRAKRSVTKSKKRSLSERLYDRKVKRFMPALGLDYRFDQPPTIQLASPSDLSVTQTTYLDRNFYPRSYGYSKKITQTTIRIPENWREIVYNRNLANVDGLVTLSAYPVDPAILNNDVEIFSATWLRQGRGYSLRTETGFMARQNGITYHASTCQKALRGVARKLSEKQAERRIRTERLERLIERVDAEKIFVTVADARKIGACEAGIQEWLIKTGLDDYSTKAPLRAVFAAYQQYPEGEARQAMARAICRSRHAQKILADETS